MWLFEFLRREWLGVAYGSWLVLMVFVVVLLVTCALVLLVGGW